MKLVFATNNTNKIKEVQALVPKHIELLSLADIGCTEDIPETAPTLSGNAKQKANYVKEKYGYDCFADDTGLEIEALQGAPGVYSARYAGASKDPDANMNKVLHELGDTPNRNAQFKTVIALILDGNTHVFTGICKGTITTARQGIEGFGYDPIFTPEGYSKTFAELTLSKKNEISHRGKAVALCIDFLTR